MSDPQLILRTYFAGEKSEAMLILLTGMLCLAAAIALWFWVREPFAKGLASALLIAAALGIGVGGSVYFRTDASGAAAEPIATAPSLPVCRGGGASNPTGRTQLRAVSDGLRCWPCSLRSRSCSCWGGPCTTGGRSACCCWRPSASRSISTPSGAPSSTCKPLNRRGRCRPRIEPAWRRFRLGSLAPASHDAPPQSRKSPRCSSSCACWSIACSSRSCGPCRAFFAIPRPTVFVGPDSALRLCASIGQFGFQRVMIVTDAVLVKLGLVEPMRAALVAQGIDVAIHDGITPDPTFPVLRPATRRFAPTAATRSSPSAAAR